MPCDSSAHIASLDEGRQPANAALYAGSKQDLNDLERRYNLENRSYSCVSLLNSVGVVGKCMCVITN